ncbi:MAG: GTP diphosphokinase [Pseudomonadota bacterium]
MVTIARSELGLDGRRPFDLEGWLQCISEGRSEQDMAMIRRAYEIAERAHHGQMRASGIPYILHCVSVADILADLRLDSNVIAAALLHDAIEDTEVTAEFIAQETNADVAGLVQGVTKMRNLPGWRNEGAPLPSKQHMYAENLRKMVLAMAEDVRVVLIKLADRTHNMRTLGSLPEDKRRRVARETLEIVAPLANRLGIWQIKWELEDLALKYLEPERYKYIASRLDERRIDRENYINEFVEILRTHLERAGIQAAIKGRPKHIYSIWRKMDRKQLDFERIFDVRAVRVVLPEIAQCYAALGVVHSLWPYVPGEFDDYIATPKGNNYQSLHTAVIGPQGKIVEVQLRTSDMDHHAEYGVAAHWRYKEGALYDSDFNNKVAWLRQVLEWKEETLDASDFVDRFKTDLLGDRVYVLTPAGKIIDLPSGATPVDFAYAVHTDIGHRCRGAEVNGRIVPLNYQLQTGEQVKILTVKHGAPSRDWLNPHLGYLKTSRARGRILAWFKHQDYDKNVSEGRRILEKELDRLNFPEANFEKLAQKLKFEKVDDFMAALSRNEIKMGQIMAALQEHLPAEGARAEALPMPVTPRKPSAGEPDVKVHGVGDLLTNMANCCKPVPGDLIVGYITRGRGISIHRADCSNLLRLQQENKERLIEVDWSSRVQSTYPVDLHIEAFDRPGLLRDITAVFANEDINLIAANTYTDKKTLRAEMRLTIEINALDQLSKVLAKISQLPNVQSAQRARGK